MAQSFARASLGRPASASAGSLAGLAAGPFFLLAIGVNTWASLDYLRGFGWEFVGGADVPWPSSLARGPYGWAQTVVFLVTGLLIATVATALSKRLPDRRASRVTAALVGTLGLAFVLAAFPVDDSMLRGREPSTWYGWIHGIAFLLIVATAVLAPLAMALAVRGVPEWRPMAPASVLAAVLFAVFLLLPWGNATFTLGLATVFGWLAATAGRLLPRATT